MASLYLHVCNRTFSPQDLRLFLSSTAGSKWHNPSVPAADWSRLEQRLKKTPAFCLGETPHLAAGLIPETFPPAAKSDPLVQLFTELGEDPVPGSPESLAVVRKALTRRNPRGTRTADPDEASAFVRRHFGKLIFLMVW